MTAKEALERIKPKIVDRFMEHDIDVNLIEQALEHAKKEHELLGLKNEMIKLMKKFISQPYADRFMDDERKYELDLRIKELEVELNE